MARRAPDGAPDGYEPSGAAPGRIDVDDRRPRRSDHASDGAGARLDGSSPTPSSSSRPCPTVVVRGGRWASLQRAPRVPGRRRARAGGGRALLPDLSRSCPKACCPRSGRRGEHGRAGRVAFELDIGSACARPGRGRLRGAHQGVDPGQHHGGGHRRRVPRRRVGGGRRGSSSHARGPDRAGRGRARVRGLQDPPPRGGGAPLGELPRYEVEGTGPDHARRYLATVSWWPAARGAGEGRSKKDAEQAAARVAWAELPRAIVAEAVTESGTVERRVRGNA